MCPMQKLPTTTTITTNKTLWQNVTGVHIQLFNHTACMCHSDKHTTTTTMKCITWRQCVMILVSKWMSSKSKQHHWIHSLPSVGVKVQSQTQNQKSTTRFGQMLDWRTTKQTTKWTILNDSMPNDKNTCAGNSVMMFVFDVAQCVKECNNKWKWNESFQCSQHKLKHECARVNTDCVWSEHDAVQNQPECGIVLFNGVVLFVCVKLIVWSLACFGFSCMLTVTHNTHWHCMHATNTNQTIQTCLWCSTLASSTFSGAVSCCLLRTKICHFPFVQWRISHKQSISQTVRLSCATKTGHQPLAKSCVPSHLTRFARSSGKSVSIVGPDSSFVHLVKFQAHLTTSSSTARLPTVCGWTFVKWQVSIKFHHSRPSSLVPFRMTLFPSSVSSWPSSSFIMSGVRGGPTSTTLLTKLNVGNAVS